MTRNRTPFIRVWLLAGLLTSSSLILWNCSSKKSESTTGTNTAASDSSVFGREGDTANNSLNAPQQAPPDSGDRGAVVPAEVKVTPKK
jgi:hypothetical protein